MVENEKYKKKKKIITLNPLIYPRCGDLPHNVPKLVHDPPELANVWQNQPSVQSTVRLDEKSVTCKSRDLGRVSVLNGHLNKCMQYLYG
jgi:hypothetical protein